MSRHSIHTLLTGLFTCALLSILFTSQAFADAPIRQGGNLGVGIGTSYGAGTGLSLKYFMSDSSAIQGTVGARFNGDYIGATLDYMIEIPAFVQSEVIDIGPAVGAGASLGLSDRNLFVGIQGVAGLEFMLNPVPIDFVVEWRPSLSIIPDPRLGLLGGAGHIRYYF